MSKKVKFGVFSDMHPDIVPNGVEKMERFLEACRREQVDFIIQLGDFCCPPDKEGRTFHYDKQKILDLYNGFEKPAYHVMGNHEFDFCSKSEILAHYGDFSKRGKAYYSFDAGGFHFVVLDTNYFLMEGKEYSYGDGISYADRSIPKVIDYVPKEELDWLEEDLANTKYPTVTFSHAMLFPYSALGSNEKIPSYQQRLIDILSNAPSKVYMCLNGHYHFDRLFRTNHIWQYSVNSMTNCWVGSGCVDENNFTTELHEKFPLLKFVVPYKDPVFAVIEMDEDGAKVKGVKSSCVGKTAEERGVYESNWMYAKMPMTVTPSITNRRIPFINPIK